MATNQHCLMADVLGFKKLLTNLAATDRENRVARWTGLTREAAIEVGIPLDDVHYFSDTVVVLRDPTEEQAVQLLQYGRLILEKGARQGLFVRGAFATGEVSETLGVWHGRAIMEAYLMMESLKWIGIAGQMSDAMGTRLQVGDWEYACHYPVPRSEGNAKPLDAVVWDVPPASEIRGLMVQSQLFEENQPYMWPVATKVDATTQFRSYVRWARAFGLSPLAFDGSCGRTPADWIEAITDELLARP